MENQAKIEAWDIYKHRTNLVEENSNRLGTTSIKTKVQDASLYEKKYNEKFDKILLDVPCLGIGVLKRKPDIKWMKNKEDIEKISKIQYEILQNCSKYLKSQGEMVYSTCSILKEENEEIITKFLAENEDFYIKELDFKDALKDEKSYFDKFLEHGFLQVYQNERTDGFFICKLSKK